MKPLETVEVETAPEPAVAIIWLHGLGADGHDFAGLVPELATPGWPAVRFVFPHAPIRPITVNGGLPMRAWYDIKSMSIAREPDTAGIDASIGALEQLIQRENRRGIVAENLLLAGFSQGGAIALEAMLRLALPLAGVIALSTYLPNPLRAPLKRPLPPVFQGHGDADPVVPMALAEQARAQLQRAGARLAWHRYSMGHQVCTQEISDLRHWLQQTVFDRP